MLKKSIYSVLVCIAALCLILIASGCQDNDQAEHAQIKNLVMHKDQIVRYESLQEQLKDAIQLNLLKVRDGVFYGMGYGATGDGCQVKSFYAFDTSGSRLKLGDESGCVYMEAVEFPMGSDIWYGCQRDKNCQISRINYRTLEEEILIQELPDMENLSAHSFGVDSQSVYYVADHSIFRRNFAAGKAEKLADNVNAEDVNQLFVCGQQLFIDEKNACTAVNLSSGVIEECFQGKIVGWSDSSIYYAQKDQDGTIIKSCDAESGNITPQLRLNFDLSEWARLQNNRYIIDWQDSQYVRMVDVKKKTVYEIDVQAMTELAGKSIDAWYVDDHNLYAQSICDWDLGEERPDQFYKWKWN